jgi:hypothetical protein
MFHFRYLLYNMITIIPYLVFSLWGLFVSPSPSRTTSSEKRLEDAFIQQLECEGLTQSVLKQALIGWTILKEQRKLQNPGKLAIADFTQSANSPRLFLLDLENSRLVIKTLVAHGRNSGEEFARKFSNTSGSFMSSPGFYVTGETYTGKHGYSMKLKGLQPGINDLAEPRSIVLHGADYVSEDFIQRNGRLGRSLGCPAVPEALTVEIIDFLKHGSCLYIHASNVPPLNL